MSLMTIANIALFTGEDLVAAFLPELAHKDDMGRISALGWGAGYIGGLLSLGVCSLYMFWAQKQGMKPVQYVPFVMVLCAAFFAIAVIPTFMFLKERAVPDPDAAGHNYIAVGFARLKQTIKHARHYRDLFNFLITLFVYSCGTQTIIHMASVYAQKVYSFTPAESNVLILVVIVTAAIGAGLFGYIQDRAGSVRTLAGALGVWMMAMAIAAFGTEKWHFWVAGNLVGLAMGASGSVGRALVAQFSPPGRSGEFLGLWGMSVKLATCVGAMTFGAVTYLSQNNDRMAVIVTGLFFVVGVLLLFRIDEKRGKLAAAMPIEECIE
jgi:UMF1 family MFS transporter